MGNTGLGYRFGYKKAWNYENKIRNGKYGV